MTAKDLLDDNAKPPRRFMDVMKKDIQRVDVTEEPASDRVRWRQPAVGKKKIVKNKNFHSCSSVAN